MRTAAKAETRTHFEMLLATAFESSTLRVLQGIRGLDQRTLARAYDNARTATRQLGYFCRHHGRDARQSPLFQNIEFQADYAKCYEKGRRVSPAVLTPKLILDHTALGNVVVWNGWSAVLWDHAASGCWEKNAPPDEFFVSHVDGRQFRLKNDNRPFERVRQVYRLMAGESYRWDDPELPDDSGCSSDYLALS
jgi:hypothetical protein